MIQGIRLVDFHTHFPTTKSWFPDYENMAKHNPYGKKDVQSEIWREAWDFPSDPETPIDDKQTADRWYHELEQKGVERVVFVSGGGNDNLAEIVARHPDKFVGFAHHNPSNTNAAEELERAVRDLGMKGYKILGPAIDTPMNDTSLYEVWEVCQRYEIPVLIHFGVLGAAGGTVHHVNMNPLIMQKVVQQFPKVPFVFPHLGCGYPTELLHLCWSAPNVYVDSSGSNQWTRWMMPEITLQDLFRKFTETIGPERLIFGTDSSGFPRGFSEKYLFEQNKIVRFMRYSEEDLDLFFHKNAERLLKLV